MTSIAVADALGRAAGNLKYSGSSRMASRSESTQVWARRKEFIGQARQRGLADKLQVFYLVDPEGAAARTPHVPARQNMDFR
jgi:hypothetical protein